MNTGLWFSARRFALVGLASTLLHIVVAVSLIEMMLMHPVGANGIAFIVANQFSYIANTLWSFQSELSLLVWLRFIIVSLGAWCLTLLIAWVVEYVGGHYLLGIGLIVITTPALSFAAHRLFTYQYPKIPKEV